VGSRIEFTVDIGHVGWQREEPRTGDDIGERSEAECPAHGGKDHGRLGRLERADDLSEGPSAIEKIGDSRDERGLAKPACGYSRCVSEQAPPPVRAVAGSNGVLGKAGKEFRAVAEHDCVRVDWHGAVGRSGGPAKEPIERS
jgi:hypothetical protein